HPGLPALPPRHAPAGLPRLPTRRSSDLARADDQPEGCQGPGEAEAEREPGPEPVGQTQRERARPGVPDGLGYPGGQEGETAGIEDRKSTRLNSSHVSISYAVLCLEKKKH